MSTLHAVIAGSSRGIGSACALALARHGVHTVLTGRNAQDLEALEDRIFDADGSATIAPLDLTDAEAPARLADAVRQRWGKLDILVLNAAMLGPLGPVAHIDAKAWQAMLALNLTAPMQMLAAFDPLLRASGDGRVIVLTSSVARVPRAYWGAYAATKAALEALILAYVEESRAFGRVRAAIIDPGATRTAMRALAFPGEDPETVKSPDIVGARIAEIALSDFQTGLYERIQDERPKG